MSIKAIKPHGFRLPDRQIVAAELDRLGRTVTSETKAYPSWRPWKSPPKSGPHAGGRRTGDLGRSWGYRVQSGGSLILRVESTNVRYARWVQGRDQTRVMKGRGWRTVQANFTKAYPETQKRLRAWARVRVA